MQILFDGRKSLRKRLLKNIAIVGLLLLAFAIAATAQADGTMRIEIVRNSLRINLALPPIQSPTESDFRQASRQILQVIKSDLERPGIFQFASDDVIRFVGGHSYVNTNQIPFDTYGSRSVDAVLLARLLPNKDKEGVSVEARLFSVSDKNSLFKKNYSGRMENVRDFAHYVASDILYHFMGVHSVFRSKIYYASTQSLPANTQFAEIWRMDYDGGSKIRRTFSNSLKLFPSMGSGDSGLVYTSFINDNADVYRIVPGGGDARIVFKSAYTDMAPSISPDGTKIAYSSSVARGNMDVYICDLDGGNQLRLTTHSAIDSSPCWSPDGQKIAYTSGRSGSTQIYTMNADGSNQRRLTYDGRYNDGADWSPDGRYIAYAARRGGSKTFDVKVHDIVSEQEYYVTRDVQNDENPSFSPDSKSLAFASDRGGRYQIFTIDLDGNNMRQLTFEGESKHPSWQK
jgi:TolB protein